MLVLQIIKKEGVYSLFKGAGSNLIKGIAGGGVLCGFDKIVLIYNGHV